MYALPAANGAEGSGGQGGSESVMTSSAGSATISTTNAPAAGTLLYDGEPTRTFPTKSRTRRWHRITHARSERTFVRTNGTSR
jgi:hypothetical protein